MATWVSGGSATVQKVAAKKHYYRSGTISCSAIAKYAYTADGTIFWYFSPGGEVVNTGNREITAGTVISQTISGSNVSVVTPYIYAGSYSTPSCSSVSAVYNYGSKAVPTVYGSPSSGFVNPANDNLFSFGSNYISGIDEQYTVSSGTFYYKKTSEENYTSDAFSGRQYTIPANTLEIGETYNYYAVLTLDDGTTAQTPTYTLDTNDGTATITPVAPSNMVIYGETDFRWNYSNTKGTAQYAYDIQLSDDDTTWTTIFNHVVSSEQTSAVYSGITAGTKYWRARGYNQQDSAGAWSDSLSFVCNVPPSAPTITSITGNGRKTVAWDSTDQVAFHLLVEDTGTGKVIFDSGDVYSSGTEYLINEYLPNGDYTVKVKIINVYGKESPYADAQFTESSGTLQPTMGLDYNQETEEVLITAEDANASAFYLKRNGILIAKFTGGTYSDKYANGHVTYELISVDAYDNFGSTTGTIDVQIDSAKIILPDGSIIVVSERWNDLFSAAVTEERRFQANEFLGASAPTHTFAKMRVKRYTFVFEDKDRIAPELLGQVVFYADKFGNADWVVPVGYNRTDYWFGDGTSMQLERTEHSEVISYEV